MKLQLFILHIQYIKSEKPNKNKILIHVKITTKYIRTKKQKMKYY